jgi:hypothetical protein
MHKSFDQRSVSAQNLQQTVTDSPYINFKAISNGRNQNEKLKNYAGNSKSRVKINDYISMRNHGYLTSDSLGVNRMSTTNNYY